MAGVETLNEARGKLQRVAGQLHARYGRRLGTALILMTDDARDTDWAAAAHALPAGSAVVVRHRDAREREVLARRLRPICAARRIALLIADDAGLATRLRADGVHVPEKHAASIAGLRRSHPQWLITMSVHSAKAVSAARGADAVLIAPVFATASHPGRETLGALRLAALATQARCRAYALGGVDATSVQRLAAARLAGVALIGGWTTT